MNIRYWMVLLAGCSAMLAVSLGTTGLSFFVEPVTKDLGFERSTFTLYFTFITLIGVFTMPIIGKMVPKFGVRNLLLVGGIWVTVGFVWLSFSSSLLSFYAAGIFMGIIYFACTSMTAVIVINTWFVAKKGLILGIVMASSGVGGAILGVVMPGFIAGFGWRAGYLLLGALFFIFTVPAAIFLLKNKPQDVGLMPYGTDENINNESSSTNYTGVPYNQVLKSRQFYILYVAIALLALVAGFLQHMPAYFTGKGLSPAEAGSLMSILMLVMVFSKIIMGYLNDVLGTIATLAIVLAIYITSFMILPFFAAFGFMALSMVLMSFGSGSPSVLPPLITSKVFGEKDFTAIWGIMITAGSLGTALGAPLWGITYDITGSYDLGVYIASAILIIVFLLVYYCISSAKAFGKVPISNVEEMKLTDSKSVF